MASSKWKGNIANWLCCGHNQLDPIPNAPPGVPDLPVFKMENITLEGLDELLDCIEKQLDRLDRAASSSISLLASQWNEYTGYATSFVQKLPTKLAQKVAQTGESLFLPLLSQALGGLGNLHWMAVGLSFIAWSLDMVATNAQNYNDCLDLLKRTVPLLKKTRKLWQVTSDNDTVKALQNLVEIALQCAIICDSMKGDSLLRIVKASTIKDSIANVHNGLDRAVQQISYFMQVDEHVEGKRPLQRQVTYPRNDETVGGDEVMREAMERLTRDDSQIVAVCLHGMGGIGKSTIGLNIFAVFQGKTSPQKARLYRCCRVELRMGIKESELPGIQKQILGILCRHDRPHEFFNALDGRKLLEQELKKLVEPVFLYLDNVLEETHLSELLPRAEFFPKGSKVLVTTRYEQVCGGLVELGIRDCKPAIPVKKMDEQEAEVLLRRHAGPPPIDKEMERMVLKLCDGLPLALKLVGSYINAHNEQGAKVWKRVINAMRAAQPLHGAKKDPLYSSLRFSIDDLDPNVKKAFLDIVAFAEKGWSWSDAEHVVSPEHLENLRQRALVERIRSPIKMFPSDKGEDQVALHDVLETMGLKMVKEDKEEIRITCEDDSDKCRSQIAWEKVVGLRRVRVQAQQLRQMPRLRFLGDVTIDGECQPTSAKLKNLLVVHGLRSKSSRPFDMSACTALKALSSWECLGDVRDLQVLGSESQLFQQLETLTIRGWNSLLSVDAVTRFPSLRVLGISKCGSLQSLPKGIANLTDLEELDLSHCKRLQSLPEGIASLTNLKRLQLGGCKSLQSLPEGVASLTGLEELDLSGCERLQSLPEEIASLTNLKRLPLGGCKSLQSLPEGVASLTGLEELNLRGCKSLQSLPKGIASLTGLEKLDLSWCKRLQSLPEGIASLTNLKRLQLWDCESLQSLPEGVASLTGLEELDLSGCERLQSLLEGIASLTNLKRLELQVWESHESLPEGVASLTGLEELDLSWCKRLQSLPEGIASLTNLKRLQLWGCESLQSLPKGISSLTGLERLNLSGCERLQSLPASLTNLKRLQLGGCKSLQSLPEGVASLTGLEELDLSGCERLQSLLEGIASLTNLKRLQLQDWESLQSLPEGVASLTGLEELDLSGCERLQSLPEGIASLTNLKRLQLCGCCGIQALPDGMFGQLTRLETLGLDACGCPRRTLARPLKPASSAPSRSRSAIPLRAAHMWNSSNVVGGQIPLYFTHLFSLPEEISQLTSLHSLDLQFCCEVEALPACQICQLTGLKNLELRFRGCSRLPEDILQLNSLSHLRLVLKDGDFEALPSGLSQLQRLSISTM